MHKSRLRRFELVLLVALRVAEGLTVEAHRLPIDSAKVVKLKSPQEVFSERASLIFKTTQVVRFYDPKRRALIYLTYTDRVIEGSPQNSISVVPVGLR